MRLYHGGGGLYLQVSAGGAKSWIFRFMLDGRSREMGLGAVHAIPLVDARKRAAECHRMRFDGIDPIEVRRAEREQKKIDAAKSMTFDACAAAYIDAHTAGWRNAKHIDQWSNTLATYAGPVIGSLPVQAVDVGLVDEGAGADLEREARNSQPSARSHRKRARLGEGARLTGGREPGEVARSSRQPPSGARQVRRVEHHPTLPYDELADFIAELRGQEGIASRALEFLILTAARTGEVIGARWDEIDLGEKMWVVPAARMKAGREHRVPLSAAVAGILEEMKKIRESDFVFPGGKKGKPLSNVAMLAVLKRIGRSDLTSHGIRSSFRDWAAERTNFPREVAEMALAHTVGDKVEAAYRRGDLFQKRRQLMDAWAKFCETTRPQAEVVRIGSRA